MDFISIPFLFYFLPITLLIFNILPQEKQKTFITIASLVFYAWGGTWFLFVTLFSLGIDYWLANNSVQSAFNKKKYLFLSLVLNITPLLYFKLFHIYTIESNSWLSYAIPIGLSLIALQRISYSIDIYRDKELHFTNLDDYAFYHLFFPKLITGPLSTLKNFKSQIIDFQKPNTLDSIFTGGKRFSIGLIKKVIIVSTFSSLTKEGFDNMSNLGIAESWLTIITFSLQLFIELSAYADMAIGLGLMFGFKLVENFNNPYSSPDITKFWSNWMISIYTWFKEYLSPLVNKPLYKTAVAFAIVGLLLGYNIGITLFLIVHILWYFMSKTSKSSFSDKIGHVPSVILTFILISITWIFLRQGDINLILESFKSLIGLNINSYELNVNRKFSILFSISIIIIFAPLAPRLKDFDFNKNEIETKLDMCYTLLLGALFLCSIVYLSTENIDSFTLLRF